MYLTTRSLRSWALIIENPIEQEEWPGGIFDGGLAAFGWVTFNMKESHTVLKWVRKYQEHGEKGLIKNNQKYDGKFKQNVVEYMHKNHLSLTETCIKFNLGNNQIVAKWEKIYSKEGPQALYEERRGRMKKMNFKLRKRKLTTESAEDLIAEVERLRMENAY